MLTPAKACHDIRRKLTKESKHLGQSFVTRCGRSPPSKSTPGNITKAKQKSQARCPYLRRVVAGAVADAVLQLATEVLHDADLHERRDFQLSRQHARMSHRTAVQINDDQLLRQA
mmetsp:Transcript_72422/g.189813  ORF Transcript_72422/g.189813 Transcript_72422/m.189813 type:complete len:115 (-) Transcript_72422:339-683(-)